MITKYDKYIKENTLHKVSDYMHTKIYNFIFKDEYKKFKKEYKYMIDIFDSIFSKYKKYGYIINSNIEPFSKSFSYNFTIDIRYNNSILDIISIDCDYNFEENCFKYHIYDILTGIVNYIDRDSVIKQLKSLHVNYNNIEILKKNIGINIFTSKKDFNFNRLLLTNELYDELTDYFLIKNNENYKYIDISRCSEKIKNKWEYLFNANNFDLL